MSKVRCRLRIDSNIGRRKVDADGPIFNQKELTAERAGLGGVRSNFACGSAPPRPALRGQAGKRPSATCGKMPRTKIRITMMTIAASESRLIGIAATLPAAGCQYIAFTTFK